MTFKKPSGNSSFGDESPNNDDKADGAPTDDSRRGDCPTAENARNKRLADIERNAREIRWVKSRSKRCQGLSGDCLFDMGDDLYSDEEDVDVSSWCRFMNHMSKSTRIPPLVMSRQDVLE